MKGLYKFRVGDWRVIYTTRSDIIHVLLVGHGGKFTGSESAALTLLLLYSETVHALWVSVSLRLFTICFSPPFCYCKLRPFVPFSVFAILRSGVPYDPNYLERKRRFALQGA